MRELVDVGLFTDTQAKAAGLVDQIETFEAFRARAVGEKGAWVDRKWRQESGNEMQALMLRLGAVPRPKITAPHVALLYAVGNVVDGEGGGALSAGEEIASRPLGAALRAAADDDSVKAVVLRVDSPGGSALASEIHLARGRLPEEQEARGRLAWATWRRRAATTSRCGATKIFAQPDTLTGSIGVVGGKMVLGGALESFGVKLYEMGRGKHVVNLFDRASLVARRARPRRGAHALDLRALQGARRRGAQEVPGRRREDRPGAAVDRRGRQGARARRRARWPRRRHRRRP